MPGLSGWTLFNGLTWLNRLRMRVPSLRTIHVSSCGIHGNHWIGGTPTEYLSTASVRVDWSSSYVSSQRTYTAHRKVFTVMTALQNPMPQYCIHHWVEPYSRLTYVILPSMPSSPKWSPPFKFSSWKSVRTSHLSLILLLVQLNEDEMDTACSRHGKYGKRIKPISLEDIRAERTDNIKMRYKEPV